MSVGVVTGGGASELRDRPHAAFLLGGRGSVLFSRERERDMAIGPYVDVSTLAFDSFELGTGAEWLIPVGETWSAVASAGGLERQVPGEHFLPALSSRIFFGSRSYNFSSWYGMAAGFFVEGRLGIGPSHQSDVLAGVQIDLGFFALPFLLAYGAVRR